MNLQTVSSVLRNLYVPAIVEKTGLTFLGLQEWREADGSAWVWEFQWAEHVNTRLRITQQTLEMESTGQFVRALDREMKAMLKDILAEVKK